jgi:predicted Zn-dependent peptidase
VIAALTRLLERGRSVRRGDLERFRAAQELLTTQLRLDEAGVAAAAQRLLHDLRTFSRPRSLAERVALLAAVSPEEVAAFVTSRPPLRLTRITVGPPWQGA